MSDLTRENRFHESSIKIREPFIIDPSMCIYSPQENVDSLKHPKIRVSKKYMSFSFEVLGSFVVWGVVAASITNEHCSRYRRLDCPDTSNTSYDIVVVYRYDIVWK